jgi:hypothetical protein
LLLLPAQLVLLQSWKLTTLLLAVLLPMLLL